ncbi:LptF/LptG family permease [Mucisphaera sp.]|uniref:LptF/LptG family permease n=1 Tax=Mucisphaera sp. TaxID=2913024 RepID=UPI003D1323E5
MTVLDRYILRQFFLNFVILLAVLVGLFVLIDLILNLDEFMEAGRVRADRFGGVWLATAFSVFDYYGPLAVLAVVNTVGLISVGAMAFTLVSMYRGRELVALVASGLSLHRVGITLLAGSMVLSLLTFPLQELVIPSLTDKLSRGISEVERDSMNTFSIRLVPDEKGALFTAASFDVEEQRMQGVSILERTETGTMKRRIVGESARWDEARGGWVFEPVAYGASPVGPGADPLAAVRLDPEVVSFYETELSPTLVFARRKALFKRLLSMEDLQMLASSEALHPAERASVTQIIWGRFSLLVVNVLVVAIGLPFFLLRSPTGLMQQSIKAAVLCVGCWGAALVMLQAGAGFNPVAIAWLPAALGLPLATAMLQSVET